MVNVGALWISIATILVGGGLYLGAMGSRINAAEKDIEQLHASGKEVSREIHAGFGAVRESLDALRKSQEAHNAQDAEMRGDLNARLTSLSTELNRVHDDVRQIRHNVTTVISPTPARPPK